jgi:hypothetical protein
MKYVEANFNQILADYKYLKDKIDILDGNCSNWRLADKWIEFARKRLIEIERALVKNAHNTVPCWRVYVNGWTPYNTDVEGDWPKTATIYCGWRAIVGYKRWHYFEPVPYGVSSTNEPLPPRRGFWAK